MQRCCILVQTQTNGMRVELLYQEVTVIKCELGFSGRSEAPVENSEVLSFKSCHRLIIGPFISRRYYWGGGWGVPMSHVDYKIG